MALGRGLPLHYLAEPESSTRTTADAAGTPTFKRLERRQEFFKARVHELLRVVVQRRLAKDERVNPEAKITIKAADISERDNAALALAVNQIITAMRPLVTDGFLTAEEYMRWVYRFGGEVIPANLPKPNQQETKPATNSAGGVHVDAESGIVTDDSNL